MIGRAVKFGGRLTAGAITGGARATAWAVNNRAVQFGAVGTAGAIGAGKALINEDGPMGDVQESLYGSRQAYRGVMQGSIATSMNRNEDSIGGGGDYYYGRYVDTSSGSNTPVSGDMILGMYNLRRG